MVRNKYQGKLVVLAGSPPVYRRSSSRAGVETDNICIFFFGLILSFVPTIFFNCCSSSDCDVTVLRRVFSRDSINS